MGLDSLAPYELRLGKGGHPLPFPLPHDMELGELRRQLEGLEIPRDGLPEEELFRDPDLYRDDLPPWVPSPEYRAWNGIEDHNIERLKIWEHLEKGQFDLATNFKWLVSKDWWMHQHDRQHTGAASGSSNINSGSAHRLFRQSMVAVDGPIITKPAIVGGKIYIGSGKSGGGSGGTLYQIDLASGAIDQTFATSGTAFYSWKGIGGSPAVVGNRIYISTVYGKIYCIDKTTFAQIWMTNLKVADQTQNQPVNNPDGDSWSGPLVVNNRVYVTGGEGESSNPYGFIFCLNANTGQVIWLFCTNKFVNPNAAGTENHPNVIPRSAAISDPLPAWATNAGFTIHNNPANKGSSPWSSCAWDRDLNRIYVCTGNAIPDTPLPDERYASGLISLDATTGDFRGFFQPAQSDSYWPNDFDVDVPCSPTVYTRSGGQRVVCFGSKNGSFFILDADTLAVVARRQLLPKEGGTGLPGDVGTSIDTVVPTGAPNHQGENKWGVMATPAVHTGLGRVFVGMGGYMGIGDATKTPFMRAVDFDDLTDAWPTAVGGDNVIRYTTTSPPMYMTNEAGLSAPAVVNDVVFVSTSKTALYALDANTGLCLWSASAASLGGSYSLGPAIYGDYVVLGSGNTVYIYRLRSRWYDFLADLDLAVQWPIRRPGPWPEPDPLILDLLRQILETVKR
jgi:outer membrane protein assembly factor BamB